MNGVPEAGEPIAKIVPYREKKEDFVHLPITNDHAYQVGFLPDIHRDPFDRPLVAQAYVESLTLVSKDSLLPKYNIPMSIFQNADIR